MTYGATYDRSSVFPEGAGELLAALRSLGHLPRDQVLAHLGYAIKRPFFSTPLYLLTLAGRAPTALYISPTDPWPGDAAAGAAVVEGCFTLLGVTVRRPMPLWAPVGMGRRWCEEMSSFSWLRDLRAAGGDSARRTARQMVGAWLDGNRRWDPVTWGPVVTGRRLANWLGQYDFFAASADVEFRHRLLREMARQGRHLSRVLPAGLSGSDAIAATKGLIYVGVCLPGAEAARERGLAFLESELPRQVLADGCHAERSPARHLRVLRDLIDIRATLVSGDAGVPPQLQSAIEQMTPMLRLFQHGDGALALFNDSGESADWQVDMVLQRSSGRGRPLTSAPVSGFQRLHAGRTLVIVDTGLPPKPGFDSAAHAGTLSFEMSVGRERLIVNCGAQPSDGEWRTVQRATAAHSTAVVADTNSAHILPAGGMDRGPEAVTCRRDEADGNTWLDMSHDGYRSNLQTIHHRRLYLAASGEDLRGEDRFEGPPGKAFKVRFHLHPSVKVSLTTSGDAVLLRLPKGDGWRLRARGAEMHLDHSVYLGQPGIVRRGQQVVLSGTTAGEATTVKWALKREAKLRKKR